MTICFAMQHNDAIKCTGDCNFVVQRQSRQDKNGRTIVEDVERCTCCGFVLSRVIRSGRGAS